MHITLVHNPGAGDGRHAKAELTGLLERQGYRVQYRSTQGSGLADQLADPGGIVVVAGGDGAVSEVAKRMTGGGVPLAILPLGTANNIARTLGITGSIEELIARLPDARPRPFDLGVIQGPDLDARFLEGVGMGLFTEAMCKIQSKEEPAALNEKLTRDDRFLALLTGGFSAQPIGISADGEDLSGDYVLCEVLNIRSVGPALELAPRADPADGQLDLVLVSERERDALREYFAARLTNSDAVFDPPMRRASEIRITRSTGGLRVDDEIVRTAGRSAARLFSEGGAAIRVERHALEFLVP
jgi:diacylglycerol kinase family enzyme